MKNKDLVILAESAEEEQSENEETDKSDRVYIMIEDGAYSIS